MQTQIIYKYNKFLFYKKFAYPEQLLIFQQDNEPKHSAKIVKDWLKNQNCTLMDWRAHSPELHSIENLGAMVKRRLGRFETAPCNLDELWKSV